MPIVFDSGIQTSYRSTCTNCVIPDGTTGGGSIDTVLVVRNTAAYTPVQGGAGWLPSGTIGRADLIERAWNCRDIKRPPGTATPIGISSSPNIDRTHLPEISPRGQTSGSNACIGPSRDPGCRSNATGSGIDAVLVR
jgi:hypothetical protein